MDNNPNREEVSSATAVMMGALASGVNAPTWRALKTSFLMLGVTLASMLGLAFSANDNAMMLHVVLLVLIAVMLFFLIKSFLVQIGLVPIEQQMQEIGMVPKDRKELSKKSN